MAREYKDSGIEWIGQIPKEWEVRSVKRLCHNITDGSHFSPVTQNEGKPYITVGNVYNDKIHIEEAAKISNEDFEVLVANGCQPEKGAVLLAKDGTVGRTAIVEQNDYVVLSSLGILSPSDSIIPKYLKYLLDSDSLQAQMQLAMAGSALRRITITKINKLVGLLPSLSEQQKIADYLDKVCGEVDEMVTLQETMIEELKAYKQSVITEAVTKGLDPNVPMRNSGIDWIGEIPEHWEQHQFRRIFEIKKIIAGTLGYDVLSVTQNGIKVKDLTKNEGQIAQDYSKYQLVDVDDYVMNHMDLLTGYVDCSKQNGVTSPDYRVFRAIDKTQISLAYYLKIFQTCYKEKIFYHLGQGVSGMGRWRLPAEQLKLFVLPMPPLSEQHQIASYLDTKCSEIDSLIAMKQAKIEELKEYKKSLIYEYVTGKKEVV